MKMIPLMTGVGAAMLLAACIPSVNPFYTSRDIAWEPRLLGEWQSPAESKDSTTWKFEPGEGQTYKVTVTDNDGKNGEFKAVLFKLKEHYFIDLLPANWDFAASQIDLVGAALFPGHLLVHAPQVKTELQLAFFDFEWLEKHLEKNPRSLAFHKEDKHILLTAGTRELQSFVLKHLGKGELFQKADTYVRKAKD
jgi:hypothetical protein